MREASEDSELTFEQVHEKYRLQIYNLALHLVHDCEDAEDLTVDTFLGAWRNGDRLRGYSNISAWLQVTAVVNGSKRFKQGDRQLGDKHADGTTSH